MAAWLHQLFPSYRNFYVLMQCFLTKHLFKVLGQAVIDDYIKALWWTGLNVGHEWIHAPQEMHYVGYIVNMVPHPSIFSIHTFLQPLLWQLALLKYILTVFHFICLTFFCPGTSLTLFWDGCENSLRHVQLGRARDWKPDKGLFFLVADESWWLNGE